MTPLCHASGCHFQIHQHSVNVPTLLIPPFEQAGYRSHERVAQEVAQSGAPPDGWVTSFTMKEHLFSRLSQLTSHKNDTGSAVCASTLNDANDFLNSPVDS